MCGLICKSRSYPIILKGRLHALRIHYRHCSPPKTLHYHYTTYTMLLDWVAVKKKKSKKNFVLQQSFCLMMSYTLHFYSICQGTQQAKFSSWFPVLSSSNMSPRIQPRGFLESSKMFTAKMQFCRSTTVFLFPCLSAYNVLCLLSACLLQKDFTHHLSFS